MSYEEKVQPITDEEREQRLDRKTWVTPTVSESPVNELTASGFVGSGSDNTIYS